MALIGPKANIKKPIKLGGQLATLWVIAITYCCFDEIHIVGSK